MIMISQDRDLNNKIKQKKGGKLINYSTIEIIWLVSVIYLHKSQLGTLQEEQNPQNIFKIFEDILINCCVLLEVHV